MLRIIIIHVLLVIFTFSVAIIQYSISGIPGMYVLIPIYIGSVCIKYFIFEPHV